MLFTLNVPENLVTNYRTLSGIGTVASYSVIFVVIDDLTRVHRTCGEIKIV